MHSGDKNAFTLMELLISISIISLLSSVVLASVQGVRNQARLAAGKQFEQSVYSRIGTCLQAFYNFEHGSDTTVKNVSGHSGRDGTIYSDPNYVDSLDDRGQAMEFDGSGDYVQTSSEIDFDTSGWTVSSWYYPQASNQYAHIFTSSSNQRNFATKVSKNSLTPYFYSDQGRTWSEDASASLVLNKWQHLAYVYDGSTMKIFLDGNKIVDESISSLDIPSDEYVIQGGNNEFVEGKHDNVRIYDCAYKSE